MGQPGIKGAVFEGIIAQVRELRDKGKISPAELERYLGREGVALLDTKIQVASWYSIQVYGRIRELLRDVVGGGRDQYTIDGGAASARRMIESGLYQQLEYLRRWKEWVPSGDPAADKEARIRLFRQQLNWVTTIHNSLFNFGSTKITVDPDVPDRLQLEYWDEGVMPGVCRLAVLGFWNEVSRRWSSGQWRDLWTKVDSRDHYVLRMTRGIAEI
jgi:hypothetical protein